MTDPEFFTL